jgi:hypothetical protein
VEPDGDDTLAQFVPGSAQVGVVETQGEWARIVVGGTTTWVDGRALVPPIVGTAPTAASTGSRATRSPTATHSMWSVLCAGAGVGVLVGAVVEWISSSGINSFDLPVQLLFDPSSSLTEREPRIGYFLATFGVVAILTSFSEGAVWVRRIAGLLVLVIALRFCYEIEDSMPAFSNVGFWDIIGAGPLIAGACGLALAVFPGP